MPFEALGMIETKGLIRAIEAADAMVKTANVRPEAEWEGPCGQGIHRRRLRDRDGTRRRRRGESCDRRRSGGGASPRLVSVHVIPRPHTEVEKILPKGSQDSVTA
jgi:ethanolamine utilization protein EutM